MMLAHYRLRLFYASGVDSPFVYRYEYGQEMRIMRDPDVLTTRINKLALALREFRYRMFDIPVHEGERELIAIITDLAEAIEVADQDIKWVRKQIWQHKLPQTTGDKHDDENLYW
jgi:hypothetical protein